MNRNEAVLLIAKEIFRDWIASAKDLSVVSPGPGCLGDMDRIGKNHRDLAKAYCAPFDFDDDEPETPKEKTDPQSKDAGVKITWRGVCTVMHGCGHQVSYAIESDSESAIEVDGALCQECSFGTITKSAVGAENIKEPPRNHIASKPMLDGAMEPNPTYKCGHSWILVDMPTTKEMAPSRPCPVCDPHPVKPIGIDLK